VTDPSTGLEWTDDAVTVAGRWTYVWGAKRRPFVHPLTTPAGHVLSVEAPEDHPWHHGLWFTIKYLDEDNFWEEMPPYGVLRHTERPEVTEGDDGSMALSGTLRWTRPDRETLALTERRTLTHVPLDDVAGDGAYAIDLDTTLVPEAALRLERTEYTTWGGYGGFTLRGSADLVDTRLLLPDGTTHERLVGVPGEWCDLSGTVGGEPAGLALFDHPENRRFPTPFYASTFNGYGEGAWTNFFNAAFLFHEGMDLDAGEELRIRHRAVVHDGHWPTERLQAAWQTWATA
jgi:hypothetical protein